MKVSLALEMSVTCVPLYPTWFRWKWFWLSNFGFESSSFISHMVQMKDKSELSKVWYDIVFISHMVQMKVGNSLQ